MEICEKKLCSGCGCCEYVCPRDAVSMVSDEEGFKRPVIDPDKCVECGLCQKKCPVNTTKETEHTAAYVGFAKDKALRKSSSSGGVFGLLARSVISEGGVVFGAGFGEELRVVHKAAVNEEQLSELRGSKYVQSDVGNAYTEVAEALSAGKRVLFSGTPCQCAAVKALFGDRENLLLVDVICHGTPSPLLWERFISDEFEAPVSASFRDKGLGWEEFSMKVVAKERTYSCSRYKDPYLRLFLKNVALRPSCYSCTWKGSKYTSDITLLDFWGVSTHYPHMNDNKGTSGVVVRGEKGEKAINAIKSEGIFEAADMKSISRVNPAYYISTAYNDGREEFFEDLKSGCSFKALAKKHVKPISAKDIVMLRVKTEAKVLIGKLYGLKRRVMK